MFGDNTLSYYQSVTPFKVPTTQNFISIFIDPRIHVDKIGDKWRNQALQNCWIASHYIFLRRYLSVVDLLDDYKNNRAKTISKN